MDAKHQTTKNTKGPINPAGTKLLRNFYRNKHGVKGSRKEAVKWYSELKS